MNEPNLDIGLDFTGGIAKPTLADVGRLARVGLDAVGEPQFVYVDGFEWLAYYSSTAATFSGSTAKTQLAPRAAEPAQLNLLTLPVGFFGNEFKQFRIRIGGTFPVAVGTRVGVDFVSSTGTVEIDLTPSAVAAPAAGTPFIYECRVQPSAVGGPRVFAELRVSGVSPVIRSQVATLDNSVTQTARVTCQLVNSADSIAFRRIEVFGTL